MTKNQKIIGGLILAGVIYWFLREKKNSPVQSPASTKSATPQNSNPVRATSKPAISQLQEPAQTLTSKECPPPEDYYDWQGDQSDNRSWWGE